MRIIAVLIIWTVAIFMSGPASAENRIALVIGNSNYQEISPLANPVNDAVRAL